MPPGRAPVGNYSAGRRGGDGPVAGAPAARVALPVFLTEDGLVTGCAGSAIAREADGRQDVGGGRRGGGDERRAARKATKPRCCPRCSPSATSAAR